MPPAVAGYYAVLAVLLFLVDEGREDPNSTIRWPASETPFNADDGPKWNAGLVVL